MEYERGKTELKNLAAEAIGELQLNEATTRLRLIDRLLMDCLAWSPDLIDCEQHQSGDYLDYVVGSPERLAVVEAKREGRHFKLPAGTVGQRIVPLSAIVDQSESNKDAVSQVLQYSLMGGIPVAALCNGHQLVVFLGSRQDGVPPLEGKAIVFHSLADMAENFSELWDTFSRPALTAGNVKRKLSRRSQMAPPPERLSSRTHGYPGFRERSELETDVRILAELFLLDIVQEEEVSDEFLRECYCTSGALSQYALVSKEILRTRYSAATEKARIESVKSKKGTSSRLTGDLLASAMTQCR